MKAALWQQILEKQGEAVLREHRLGRKPLEKQLDFFVCSFCDISLFFGEGDPQNPWKRKQKLPPKEAWKIAKGNKQGKGDQGEHFSKTTWHLLNQHSRVQGQRFLPEGSCGQGQKATQRLLTLVPYIRRRRNDKNSLRQ